MNGGKLSCAHGMSSRLVMSAGAESVSCTKDCAAQNPHACWLRRCSAKHCGGAANACYQNGGGKFAITIAVIAYESRSNRGLDTPARQNGSHEASGDVMIFIPHPSRSSDVIKQHANCSKQRCIMSAKIVACAVLQQLCTAQQHYTW